MPSNGQAGRTQPPDISAPSAWGHTPRSGPCTFQPSPTGDEALEKDTALGQPGSDTLSSGRQAQGVREAPLSVICFPG